jgi:hypothetical protein
MEASGRRSTSPQTPPARSWIITMPNAPSGRPSQNTKAASQAPRTRDAGSTAQPIAQSAAPTAPIAAAQPQFGQG